MPSHGRTKHSPGGVPPGRPGLLHSRAPQSASASPTSDNTGWQGLGSTSRNWLAGIVFRSFAGLGLTATGSTITMENFLQPGRLAKTGIDAGAPILEQVGEMAGLPEVFVNLDAITVMFLAWLVVVLCFFVLAIQLFITLIEFKLTTLAGFVLVPFAFWRQTTFLAERVLGNVISSGIKVLVIAIVIGIGSTMFETLRTALDPDDMTIEQAFAVVLGALTLMGLAIFCPRIAAGLVSGAPQLSAGAAAGTAIGVGAAGAGAKGREWGAGGIFAAHRLLLPVAPLPDAAHLQSPRREPALRRGHAELPGPEHPLGRRGDRRVPEAERQAGHVGGQFDGLQGRGARCPRQQAPPGAA